MPTGIFPFVHKKSVTFVDEIDQMVVWLENRKEGDQ